MFFPNACDVMAGFLGGRNNNINSSSVFVHEPFKSNFTSSAGVKKDEVLTSFPGTVTLTNNCQVLNCPDCSKPCSGYTLVNTQVRQCNDSGNWYNCNVCCARFPALRDLELHAATQVRYCCCLCNAGFHCRELYENHITEHKNDIMNHQQVQHIQQQQPVSSDCDSRKAAHTFEVDSLSTVPVSTSVAAGFLPSITQTMSIAGQIPDQIVAFTELARSQHGSFFVTAPPSTNYINQEYISIMSKDGSGKGTYSIDSFQLSKIQNKDLLQEAYPCGNNDNDNAEIQKKVTEMQNISTQESYATISVSIPCMSEIGKGCTFRNQPGTQQNDGRRLENNQSGTEDKLDARAISFVQFSDQSTSPQQFICTLCGKVFKTKITLGKHVRTVHKVELGTGADFVDFLTTSIAATTRLQQPSPSNTAVPGLDKINLLESATISEEMFSPLVKEQTSVEPIEKKIFESADNEDLPQDKKKRIRSRKASLGHSSTSRYQSSRVKYICEVCDKEFIDKMKHRVHVRTHTGEKPYACDICGKLFNTRSQVNRHRLHIHELEGKPRNRQYKNRPSGESTGKSTEGSTSGVNVSFGENQMSSNTTQQNITGSTEGQNTSTAQEVLNQSTTSNDALVNSVVYCSKTGQRVDLSDTIGGPHRRRRGLHRIYFCPVCGKPFQDKVKHAVHLRTHTGEKPYACIVCDKRFNTRSQVNRHMSVHKSIFQNPLDTTFSSEGAIDNIKSEDVAQEAASEVQLGQLSQHESQNIMRLQTGIQSDNITQPTFVGKTSKKKRNRDWQQNHMCSFCGQNFATPSGLSSHTRNRHKDQIIFNHSLFDASSGTEGNVNQTKPVDASKVCQVCGKAFRAANSLRMHMIRHSSIKPHKCPICERCFITKFESNRCQRRHSKIKSQGSTFQQDKINITHPLKPGNADATLVTGFSPESLAQPTAQAICQRVEEAIPRTETVAFPVTSNFSELTDQTANNLPVNLSSQETWLQQGYIQTSIQQQNRESFMQKAVVAHYQQMQQVPTHTPHHQFLQQQIPQELFQVMSHNMIHYTLQQDGFPQQQLQQQTQQQQQQQQQQEASDQIVNNSKRRRRMII